MFHEDSDHDVDEDELRHQDEHDEEEGRDVLVDAAVAEAVVGLIALLAQRVLHDPVPVVPCAPQPVSRPSLHVLLHFTCRDSEQGQKSHSERSKMRVLPETLAGVLLVTFCKYIIVYVNVDKYLESRSYKNTMKVL